ncbi:MAG TPA: hypothetical protein VFG95_04290, partial [Nitrospiria bacterium]|nr:hypothetical protein [Nitrospiria bacterium]
MGDAPHKMKVALVGGDRQGLELLSLLVRDSLTEVKLLVDPSPSALLFRFKEYGVDLADGGRCKLSQKVEDISLFDDLSVVIDLKGGVVRQEILKVAPAGALILDQKTT